MLDNIDQDLLDLVREFALTVKWGTGVLVIAIALRISGVNVAKIFSAIRGRRVD